MYFQKDPTVSCWWGRYTGISLAFVCGLLVACAHQPPLPQAPVFISAPQIQMAPNPKTPLAGVLKLSTNQPTRVTLQFHADDKRWATHFDEYRQNHVLPVLGFRPDKTHTIKVQVIGRQGGQATFGEPLIITTAPLPRAFPGILVESAPEKMEPGYTLFNVMPHGENKKFGALAVIVDHSGEVVWYTVTTRFRDVRKLANGNLLTMQGNQIHILDMLGNVVRKYVAVGRNSKKTSREFVLANAFHHEAFPLTNGNLLVLSVEARPYKNYYSSETDAAAPRETVQVAGDLIIEIAPDGRVVQEWSMLDTLDPYRIGFGSLNGYWDKTLRKSTRDWSHGNAVIHDPSDDSLIVSLRHQDATVKLDRQSGELIWILGTHDNWDRETFGQYLLQPVNEQAHFFPFHQHAPEVLPNGNLLIYDNGSYRSTPFNPNRQASKAFSRAVEYRIDEDNMTVELIWQYGQFSHDTYYAGALGDADFLPQKNNVLITHGGLEDKHNKKSARVIEVTRSAPGVEVFNMRVFDKSPESKNGWRIYRSERIADVYPAGGQSPESSEYAAVH